MATRGRKAGVTFQSGYKKAEVRMTIPTKASTKTLYWNLFKTLNKQPTQVVEEGTDTHFIYHVRESRAYDFSRKLRELGSIGGRKVRASVNGVVDVGRIQDIPRGAVVSQAIAA